MDLLESAGYQSLFSQVDAARQQLDSGQEIDTDSYNESFETPYFDRWGLAISAKAALLQCLYRYFGYMHHLDQNRRQEREYLKQLFIHLNEGDVVITLNWDTLAERSLGEMECWNPTTGYGFRKQLTLSHDDVTLPINPSKVEVLKLHGSCGWYLNSDEIYFEENFLRGFGFEVIGYRFATPSDPNQPEMGPNQDALLLYPSYMKSLHTVELQKIWYKAQDALDRAAKIDIWGYSLPESDTAMRVLLNVLRFRLERGEIIVNVHDRNGEVQTRWRGFLGERANVDGQMLE